MNYYHLTTMMAGKEFTNLTTFGLMTKFDPVQETGLIQTEHFLQACTELAYVLDDLGTGFSIPKKDMLGNISTIQTRCKADPEKCSILNSMLEEESNSANKHKGATALIWLRRGLDFIRAFLAGVCKQYHEDFKEESLRHVILKAYEDTLKPFHGWMVQCVFATVSRLVPYRSNFLKSLMKNPSATQDQVVADIELFLPNLKANVDLILDLLNKYGLNSQDKA